MFKFVHSKTKMGFENQVWLNFHFSISPEGKYVPDSQQFPKILEKIHKVFDVFSETV